jgi:EAL domain-containing protein (putative c-di-GMP-specific phosphodiesterase class I)
VIDRLHGVRRQRQSALSEREQIETNLSMLLRRDKALLQRLPESEGTGVSIALHDFGTGHSNMGYLQRFPSMS